MSRSSFMPLSDEDDDFSNFSLGNDSPAQGHTRQGSGGSGEGHFYAGHHSTAGMRAAQRQNSVARSGSGAFGEAMAAGRSQGGANNMQDTLQVIKTKSLGLAAFLKDKATQASSSVADPASRQQTLSRFKMWGAGAAERVQTATAQGWQQARELTSEGMKRFYGGPLAAICRQESTQRPCPRTVLICCTAIVTNGLYTEGIFKEEAPPELVHYLLGAFEEGQGICLPPPGTDPLVVAAALKHFLLTLPEPLFTYKCLPAIIAAGQDTVPTKTLDALAELPAASLNTLTILLETWHRVSENSAANGMDSRALAVAVTPCLAWNPPVSKEARKGYMTIGVPHDDEESGSWRKGAAQFPETAADEVEEGGAMARSDLEPQDLAAIISVVEYAIVNFRGSGNEFDGPLYDYAINPVSPSTARSSEANAASEIGKAPAPKAQIEQPVKAQSQAFIEAPAAREASKPQFSLI